MKLICPQALLRGRERRDVPRLPFAVDDQEQDAGTRPRVPGENTAEFLIVNELNSCFKLILT